MASQLNGLYQIIAPRAAGRRASKGRACVLFLRSKDQAPQGLCTARQ